MYRWTIIALSFVLLCADFARASVPSSSIKTGNTLLDNFLESLFDHHNVMEHITYNPDNVRFAMPGYHLWATFNGRENYCVATGQGPLVTNDWDCVGLVGDVFNVGLGLVPEPYFCSNPTFGFSVNTLDSTNDATVKIFQAPETGIINQIGFMLGSVVTNSIVAVRLETLSLGVPSGILCGINTFGNISIASTEDNTWKVVTLTSGCSVNAGDFLAIVLATTDASSNLNVVRGYIGPFYGRTPYAAFKIDGSYFVDSRITPVGLIIYSDGSIFETGIVPLSAIGIVPSSGFNVNDSPDERGITIKFGANAKVIGLWAFVPFDGVSFLPSDFDLSLYESDGSTVLGRLIFDKDIISGNATKLDLIMKWFETPIILSANTTYRVSLRPLTTTNVIMGEVTVNDASYFNVMSGGTAIHLTTRTDGGNWTDTATKRPCCVGVIVDQN